MKQLQKEVAPVHFSESGKIEDGAVILQVTDKKKTVLSNPACLNDLQQKYKQYIAT